MHRHVLPRAKRRQITDHLILSLGVLVMGAPLVILFTAAARKGGLNGAALDLSLSGVLSNAQRLREISTNSLSMPTLDAMLITSLAVAFGVAALTTLTALLAAFVMTFHRSRLGAWVFWLTLATLYFPIEARMLATFDVINQLGLISTFTGLILPVLPLALGTLVIRQHLKTLPPEVMEAARLDGAGPVRFLKDFIAPLSLGPLAAVFVIAFISGWNQYLWPLMVTVDDQTWTLMRGLERVGGGSGAGALLASVSMLPPLLLVLAFQRMIFQATRARL